MNLTKMDGCYAKELHENLTELKNIYYDSGASIEYMRNSVLEIIAPAWINATAKRRFIGYLNDCSSKREIYNLCYNTVQKAIKYKATPRTTRNGLNTYNRKLV